MKTFNNNTLDTLRNDMDAALAIIAKKHGIAIRTGTMRYDNTSVKTTVSCYILNDSSDASSVRKPSYAIEAEYYACEHGRAHGISKSHIGKKFAWAGRLFTFVGLLPKSKKYPVLCTNGGKYYKLGKEAIKSIKK